MEFQTAVPLNMDTKIFRSCLSGALSGVASGLGSCTNEMLRVYLDDIETTELLFCAVEDLAGGEVLEIASRPLMSAAMTALEKKNGRVRGIANGTSSRRLAAKTLARQFSQKVQEACAPFQFAMSTRAGTNCVGHAVREATAADPRLTVQSIDGIGAYDHVFRGAMLSKMLEVPSLRNLLPIARVVYAQPSSCV